MPHAPPLSQPPPWRAQAVQPGPTAQAGTFFQSRYPSSPAPPPSQSPPWRAHVTHSGPAVQVGPLRPPPQFHAPSPWSSLQHNGHSEHVQHGEDDGDWDVPQGDEDDGDHFADATQPGRHFIGATHSGSSHAPEGGPCQGMSEEESKWRWSEVQNLLAQYNHCKKLWGNVHWRAVAAKKEHDDARDSYFRDVVPEERAQHLSRKVQSKERIKATKVQRLSEAQLRLHEIEGELAGVFRRRDEAAQAIAKLQDDIDQLDKTIEEARQERVEVLQQASQEAQWEPAPKAASAARTGDADFRGLLEQLRRHGDVPGVEHLLSMHSDNIGEQSCPRGGCQSGPRSASQRKRPADAPAAKPAEEDMDCASTIGDEDEAEAVTGRGRPQTQQPWAAAPIPQAVGGASESFSSMEAAHHARNAAARWAPRRDPWDGPPRLGAGPQEPGSSGGPKGASPAEEERGRDRSRQRSGRRAAQQRSASAIERYQALYREQRRCAAAAESLIKQDGGTASQDAGGASSRPAVAPSIEVTEPTIYDVNEYYAAETAAAAVPQRG